MDATPSEPETKVQCDECENVTSYVVEGTLGVQSESEGDINREVTAFKCPRCDNVLGFGESSEKPEPVVEE